MTFWFWRFVGTVLVSFAAQGEVRGDEIVPWRQLQLWRVAGANALPLTQDWLRNASFHVWQIKPWLMAAGVTNLIRLGNQISGEALEKWTRAVYHQ